MAQLKKTSNNRRSCVHNETLGHIYLKQSRRQTKWVG